jgi:hypothetical protein
MICSPLSFVTCCHIGSHVYLVLISGNSLSRCALSLTPFSTSFSSFSYVSLVSAKLESTGGMLQAVSACPV